MQMSRNPIIQSIRRFAGVLGDLLSESHAPCPLCQMPARRSDPDPFLRTSLPRDARLLQLCRNCSAAVPWITHIACAVCGRPDPCPDCRRRSDAHFIISRSAVRYDDSVREWLALFKYRGDERLVHPLADMLDVAYIRLDRELRSRRPTLRWDAVIPVPVSSDRLMERGFNQAERIASQLSARRGIPMAELLVRTRHSEKKSLQSRLARLKSVDGLFTADPEVVALFISNCLSRGLIPSPNHRSVPRHPIRLLIVDDIYTTGSTIEACAAALHQAFGSQAPRLQLDIYAITLARS
ncbi:ComF family protein [Paenibacillus sp. PR3]|uniref:ComF family protein n=1 Tax=Paenibacillus terricola TaxID=2763503 RepID=A0ABR8MY04_9BACL|nr:ComF family protein [Paenibacillus terricola]MBD3920816.1 ComF family protein [Paenibacillus terricola]